jgi:hypothetical protein
LPDLVVGQADAGEQQVHYVGWQRVGRRGGGTAVRLLPFFDARAEGFLVHLDLVTEDMAPDSRVVGRPVGRVRDPGANYLAVP